MNAAEILSANAAKRRKKMFLHAALGLLLFHVVAMLAFVPLSLFFVWFIGTSGVYVLSCFVSLICFVVGLATAEKIYAVSESLYREPEEAAKRDESTVRAPIAPAVDPSYILSQIILGAAKQFCKALENRNRIVELSADELEKADRFLTALRNEGRNPRFHPIHLFWLEEEILAKLGLAQIIWFKLEQGQVMIALNRDYD